MRKIIIKGRRLLCIAKALSTLNRMAVLTGDHNSKFFKVAFN